MNPIRISNNIPLHLEIQVYVKHSWPFVAEKWKFCSPLLIFLFPSIIFVQTNLASEKGWGGGTVQSITKTEQ